MSIARQTRQQTHEWTRFVNVSRQKRQAGSSASTAHQQPRSPLVAKLLAAMRGVAIAGWTIVWSTFDLVARFIMTVLGLLLPLLAVIAVIFGIAALLGMATAVFSGLGLV